MENQYYKSTSISLIVGALLIIVTMALHPSGGSIEHIIKISKTIKIAHSLAIFSLPIILFGFYGLTIRLLDKWRLSILAFIIISFGLVAAMFAAIFNGLTLPYFLNQYSERLEENIEVLKPITNYSFAINIPLDYIFIVACCLTIMIYSIIILLENKLPKWIGYLGVFIVLFSIIGALTGFIFTSLTGFRIFTFSIAAWILSSGVLLYKSSQ
ncbi:hypothetical protein ESY86_05590 [Subsaximicrobium wynnwilliamsii]|uniref:DUF4386 family protein n=1 Tax=Subsaximicrobium wynnwilliamsii TaxID=291179 RepID=A0A5C6ZMQ1_9FLAO|nr:hypothetical protein [Subsaximicrobium wynnwilliamsii]TXD84531.1 hypothetical protein ESY87_05365 [Subsaximicrobium wynnwilliamsii]TXD90213.1 hypothetical protein ESY86_05590 [Subsaximicrobium wynnwilliamsii]TXE04264.1 hypothetical protein ESY88_05360 [Subsaximicrobium wynnwilliamsii]